MGDAPTPVMNGHATVRRLVKDSQISWLAAALAQDRLAPGNTDSPEEERADNGCVREKESLNMVKPKLQHVLVVLSYPLLLLCSLVQAAPGTPPSYAQEGRVGMFHLQITGAGAPRAKRRFELTITSLAHVARLQLAGAMLVPSSGAASPGQEQVALVPRREYPGVYRMTAPPLLAGRWFLVLTVREGKDTRSGTPPLPVADPPPVPAWLAWSIALLTLALLVYAIWAHHRHGALDFSSSVPSVVFDEVRLC
jgi:hypothetical protein